MIEYTMWIVDEYDRRPISFTTGRYDDGEQYGSFVVFDDESADGNVCAISSSPEDLMTIVTNLESILLAGNGAPLMPVDGVTFRDESDEDGTKLSLESRYGKRAMIKLDAQTCTDVCKAAREWYGKVVGQ